MKTKIIFSLIVLMVWPGSVLKSQQQPEQLNLPGDNLNLYAVMKIFQESETLELFEKKLNEEDARVNNLDLNGDNYIDYIKVLDYVEKNVHYIVLQVAVTLTENQDVAVFVVKKDPDGRVVMQLIGDEALYGKYYIVEPYYDTDNGTTPNPGYYGNYDNPRTVVVHQTTAYEVASWPLVRFIFLPGYVAWHSPWYWGYYPPYWRPWTPWYWHQYYGYHYYWRDQYYSHYHHGDHYRYDKWHEQYYGPRRSTSHTVITREEKGDYRSSYSKPESIREGSDDFRKTHPDMVKPEMKEPEVKAIRTAVKPDNQAGKVKAPEKTGNKVKGNSTPDKKKQGKSENQSGNVKPSKAGTKASGTKPDQSQTNKKEETKSTVKTATRETGSQKKEESKKENPKTPKESGKRDRR